MELKIERLSRTYPHGVHALRDVRTAPRRPSLRTLPTLLAAACTTACAPIVTHGPRVEQGFTFYGTVGGGKTLCDHPACHTNLIPQPGAGLRYGQAPTASVPGVSAGLTVSPGWVSPGRFVNAELDLYAQAPIGFTTFDAGTGVLLSPAHVMPYVQAGRMKPDGSGWYTTQGFAFLGSRPPLWSLYSSGDDAERVTPRYWAPTVAYRTRGRVGVHFYVSGAFGTARAKVRRLGEPGLQAERQPVKVVMMGMVFDVQPARRPPQAPPSPESRPAVPPASRRPAALIHPHHHLTPWN